MKILIWLLCALVYGVANALLQGAGMLLGGIPTALLCLALGGLAVFLCRAWDKRKAKEAPAEQPVAVAEAPEKSKRPALRITCIVLAVCVVILSAACAYLVVENGNLESEKLSLSNELREAEREAEWGTGAKDRYEAASALEDALQRFFYSYGEEAWEALAEILEQFS